MKQLARIPDDIGKKIVFGGNDSHMIVNTEDCEDCGKSATGIYQGETCSFGFDPVVLCDDCAEKCKKGQDEYLNALDIEDREPEDGKAFFFSATTNIESMKSFRLTTFSLRKIVSYYRKCDAEAASLGGLYPDNEWEEITPAEARDKGYRVEDWVDNIVETCMKATANISDVEKHNVYEKSKNEVINRSLGVFYTRLATLCDNTQGNLPSFTKLCNTAYNKRDPVEYLNNEYRQGRNRGWIADILGVLLEKD